MKTIRFKVNGKDRYFTPASSARRRDETEEVFFDRCARKVVPDGEAFEILEDALYADFIQIQDKLRQEAGSKWGSRLSRFFVHN